MPGDNFSLEGALELFKQAESPEHFEELLNKEDHQVNNLDLNEDGDIDYIRVIDPSGKSPSNTFQALKGGLFDAAKRAVLSPTS